MRYRTTIIASAFVFIAVAALWVARASAASSPASAGVFSLIHRYEIKSEGRAERAAIRVLERLASMQSDEPQQAQIEKPPGKKR
jgi:hypothetical protein